MFNDYSKQKKNDVHILIPWNLLLLSDYMTMGTTLA